MFCHLPRPALLALVTALACDGPPAGAQRADGRANDRAGDCAGDRAAPRDRRAGRGGPPAEQPPVDVRAVTRLTEGPRFDDPALDESSGLVASLGVPGLLWTVNDSKGDPDLFAITARAQVLGRVRLAGARNDDWEALGAGPCPEGPGAKADGCLYVGDVGDNDAGGRRGPSRGARRHVTLYRLAEPRGTLDGARLADRRRAAAALPATAGDVRMLRVRYPDRPHDVEAMAVLPDGAVWLVTKHRVDRPDGSPRPALVFRVDASAWRQAQPAGRWSGEPVVATFADSLPLVPDGTVFRRVTDAALAPAGVAPAGDGPAGGPAGERRVLAVRTYQALYLVPLVGAPWRVDHARRPSLCDLTPLREPQGEGVAVLDGPPVTVLLSSEGNVLGAGGVATAGCPPPR